LYKRSVATLKMNLSTVVSRYSGIATLLLSPRSPGGFPE
jgi:hypothetical protein